jgi:lysophospholipase L1-like esterase
MDRWRFVVVFIVIIACNFSPAQQAPSSFALKDGDRIVFYGDSITEQKLYTSDVEEFVLTRFPHWRVSFTNSGVGGDKVSGGRAGPVDLRLERDVFAYQPTVVTVMLGMNDGYARPNNPAIFETFADGYRHIVEAIQSKAPNARLVLIKPSPYDDITRQPQFENGYNSVLQRFGEFVGNLATQKHAQVADLNEPVIEALTKAKAIDPALSTTLVPDRTHPGSGVHWLMAEALLKAWGASACVASVTLDASKPVALETLNAQITDLHRSHQALTWTEMDEALPLPFPSADSDPFLDLAVRSSDLINALDQEILRISGLPPGKYRLTIDEKMVGDFGADQFGSGINLARLDTPMLEQSILVAFDTERNNDIEKVRFVLIQQQMDANARDVASKLWILEQRAVEQQRKDAQPVVHRYKVSMLP